jgi:hypothetical protein
LTGGWFLKLGRGRSRCRGKEARGRGEGVEKERKGGRTNTFWSILATTIKILPVSKT